MSSGRKVAKAGKRRFSPLVAGLGISSVIAGLIGVSAPASAATPSSYNIDVGSSTETKINGSTAYTADKYFKGGTALKIAKTTTTAGSYSKLFDTVRWGMSGYDLPVANGSYDVKLRFIEDRWDKAGQRVFDVKAEGKTLASNFDIFKEAGGAYKPLERTWRVTVTDGTLNLGFTNKVDNASIASILVFNGKLGTGTTTPPTTPPVVTPPPTTPPVTTGRFHPTTMGGSVSDAADGDFNRWADNMHGLYATWGDNGKIWAIDTPSSEYGLNSTARLGDFDLDIAPQNKIDSWSAAANGSQNAKFRQMFTEIKQKWGNRQGHVYVRPFHEFNGDWYNWSTRSTADQANFVKTWQNQMYPIWKEVMGNDQRFKLSWSPNRDSKGGLDVRKSFPGKNYVDVIGLDYYDFSRASTEAAWSQEEFSTQSGGSPVGIGSWQQFAQNSGVAINLPEWGVQFGDNPLFASKVLGYVSKYRYTGSGDASGKILGAAWHNLQGKSPDPSAGGDFFVQVNGQDYQGRKQTAQTVRTWINANKSWLYQPTCTGGACVRS